MALLDLDHFKSINDQYGHESGDDVLKQVADLLRSAFGHYIVARIGGEEFALLIPSSDMKMAKHMLEDFRERLAQQAFKIPEGKHYCTISIGLAACQSKSLSEVMRKADKALYKAKDKQRNCVIAH